MVTVSKYVAVASAGWVYIALTVISSVVPYALILGVVSGVVGAIRGSARAHWLPMLCWLFFAAGLFDAAVLVYKLIVTYQLQQMG